MKWPRHYAFAYLAAKTPEEQRQAVKGCPVEWRDLVRSHIRILKPPRHTTGERMQSPSTSSQTKASDSMPLATAASMAVTTTTTNQQPGRPARTTAMETKNAGKTATLIKRLNGFAGEARLYRLSEPVEYDKPWREGDEPSKHAEFVIVSAANVMLSGPETYIFPADKDGHIICWGELEGSFSGGLDHERALSGAGYQIFELSDDSGQRGAS